MTVSAGSPQSSIAKVVEQNPPSRSSGESSLSPEARAKAARRRENRAGYVFLTPWLIGFVGLTGGPMLVSLYLSFTSYNLFTSPRWIGIDNYVALFSDPRFLQAVKVTVTYVLVGTPIKLTSSLLIALLLNAQRRGVGLFRAAYYAPSLIGGSVAIAITWRIVFANEGVVDRVQQFVGIDIGGWVGNPTMSIPLLIALAAWQFGAPMVIFLAGLKQIPSELNEAAAIDGAGTWRRFWNVTWPMLSPVVFFNLLLESIAAFQVFTAAFVIGGAQGEPAGSTLFYTVYLYSRAFTDLRMGYASAMAWLLVVVVGLIATVMFRTSRAWVHYAGDIR